MVNGLLKLSIFFFLIPVQLVRLIHPVVPTTITWYLDDKFRFYTKDGIKAGYYTFPKCTHKK